MQVGEDFEMPPPGMFRLHLAAEIVKAAGFEWVASWIQIDDWLCSLSIGSWMTNDILPQVQQSGSELPGGLATWLGGWGGLWPCRQHSTLLHRWEPCLRMPERRGRIIMLVFWIYCKHTGPTDRLSLNKHRSQWKGGRCSAFLSSHNSRLVLQHQPGCGKIQIIIWKFLARIYSER